MFVLGLLVIMGAVVLTIAVLTSNTDPVDTSLWGLDISNVSVGAVFVAGMVVTVLALLGVVLMLGGVRRGHRVRRQHRELIRENERLAQQTDPNPADSPGPADKDRPTADSADPSDGKHHATRGGGSGRR